MLDGGASERYAPGLESEMPEAREFRPGRSPRTVVDEDGVKHDVPEGWECLPPGDAGLTRKLKALGPTWTVKEKRGRRMFSRGVWAPVENITKAQALVASQRASPSHQKKLEAGRKRREKEQVAYVAEFEASVRDFLAFHPAHAPLEQKMARAIAAHATPVGSGTVARTKRISVERRAQAATIAWMRHQTTAYDHMHIPRVKGKRREVRRMLAERSRALLQRYRDHTDGGPDCPLREALERVEDTPTPGPRRRQKPARPVVHTNVAPTRSTARARQSPSAPAGARTAKPRAKMPAARKPATLAAPPTSPAPSASELTEHERLQQEKYEQVRARLRARTSRKRR